MPSDAGFGQAGDEFGMFARDVRFLPSIIGYVIQLRLGAVEFAEEFPFAITHSEIGKIGVSVIRVTIGWAPEEYGRLAGRVAIAKQHVRE